MKHLNIQVYGRVQGVSFRYYTLQAAQKIGIAGWVKNQPDGSVYIEAEGTNQKLQQFISFCKTGSAMAKVDRIEQYNADCQNFTKFEIR